MANKVIKAAAIVLAAGASKRFGRDKQFEKIGGRAIVEISVEKFLEVREIKKIVVAFSKSNINKGRDIFDNPKIEIVEGGETRMKSLVKAFSALGCEYDIVCVHDGARPFVRKELIKNLIMASLSYKVAIPVVPLKDTVKKIIKNKVVETIDRDVHFAVQTPQCYRYSILQKALSSFPNMDLTDDSQLAERIGIKPFAVDGDYINFKITTPEDMKLAEVIYEKEIKKDNFKEKKSAF